MLVQVTPQPQAFEHSAPAIRVHGWPRLKTLHRTAGYDSAPRKPQYGVQWIGFRGGCSQASPLPVRFASMLKYSRPVTGNASRPAAQPPLPPQACAPATG